MTLASKLWDRSIPEPNSGCIIWLGAADHLGYGTIWDGSVRWKTHRLAYTLVCGPIPAGMHVCHHCDNPYCINPNHLFLGTPADNAADKKQKGRSRGNTSAGEQHSQAKLTSIEVSEIRSRYVAGESQRALARAYGVGKTTIHDIVSLKKWRTS